MYRCNCCLVLAVYMAFSTIGTVGFAREKPNMPLNLVSSAFESNSDMPTKFTCEGANVSPPLSWTRVPAETKSLVLIVDDPDAPDPAAPRMTWVHWVLYNIPVSVDTLGEGVATSDLPEGTLTGVNDSQTRTYQGPCPPIGRHRYFFKLYALDTVLPDLKGPTKKALLTAMENHVLTQAELIGLYKKK
jgi:Raf kinase inhibitor-like YbhB/YbcL family protein